MKIVPIKQKEANRFVSNFHRHHRPVIGSVFQIGCENGIGLIGVAICGRPVARKIDHTEIIEVNRVCVMEGHKNACSKLYAACARIAKEMGYKKIITYILESEPGISLRASGWVNEGVAGKEKWNSSGDRIRTNADLFGEKKYPEQKKVRWSKTLTTPTGKHD